MVDKLTQIINQILQEKNQLTLFAVLKMDELSDKWSVIVCADWATDENYEQSFIYIKKLLDEKLNQEEKTSIARISIFPKKDHAIQSLLQFRTGTTIKEDTRVNGFIIHEGYIIYSDS